MLLTNTIQGLSEALNRVKREFNTEYHTNINLGNGSQKKTESPLDIEKLKFEYKNHCLKNKEGKFDKEPSDMTKSEKLEAFIKGPCSPAVIVPGILGTALKVEIDCETLQKEEPEIFSTCGWNSCSFSIPFFRHRPSKGNIIYII